MWLVVDKALRLDELLSEVHQYPQPGIGSPNVVDHLSPVSACQLFHSLQLHDDFAVTVKVCYVFRLELLSLVLDLEVLLPLEGDASKGEFHGKCLLIDLLQKAATQLFVNLEQCTVDGIRFLLIIDFHNSRIFFYVRFYDDIEPHEIHEIFDSFEPFDVNNLCKVTAKHTICSTGNMVF